VPTARPHDLLRVTGPAALPADAPAWAVHALSDTPWVVVRRDRAPDGYLPVGVRGASRSDRYGTLVAAADVLETATPETLSDVPGRDLPAMRTLRDLRPLLDDVGLAWGPTGSVGFELATGHPTATSASDLDLLIRLVEFRGALPGLVSLNLAFGSAETRVDCQVETFCGAAALVELVEGRPEVMVRTADGPHLVDRTALS
jgi:phosphoribosyl-dephospho-CoA transferase